MSRHHGIPWWADLLPLSAVCLSSEPLCVERLERVERAASNLTITITEGLAAVGELFWRAAHDKDNPIEQTTLGDLACLQTALAELLTDLNTIEAEAGYGKHQLELAVMKAAQKKAPATAPTVQGH